MLKGNFMIGDEKNRSMKHIESSYKPAVTSDRSQSDIFSGDLKSHLSVSVRLGSH